MGANPWNGETRARRRQLTGSLVQVDDEGVAVLAVKPASRGAGVIVRLYAPRSGTADQGVRHVTVRWHDRPIARAVLCDARERDMEPLAVTNGAAGVPLDAALASVRLLLGPPASPAVVTLKG